jgi:hypothetical protein
VLDMEPTSKVPIPYTFRAGFCSPSDSPPFGKPVLKREHKMGASPKLRLTSSCSCNSSKRQRIAGGFIRPRS